MMSYQHTMTELENVTFKRVITMKLTVQKLLYVLGCGSWRYEGSRRSDGGEMPLDVRFSQRERYNATEEEVKKNLKEEVHDWKFVHSCHCYHAQYVIISLVKDLNGND